MLSKPFTPGKFRRRVFSQLWMLALQFVLGMGLNLANGSWHGLHAALLWLHVLNAVGLLEGGWYIALKQPSRLARAGAMGISLTVAAGVLTVVYHPPDLWSFVMACGFIASSWLYVLLYVRADRKMASD